MTSKESPHRRDTQTELVGVNLDFPSARNLLIDMTLLGESYNFVPENWGVKL